MNKHYRVKWEIDVEDVDINDPVAAVRRAMIYMDDYKNVSVYDVEDRKTGEQWSVDMEPESPEVTEIKK